MVAKKDDVIENEVKESGKDRQLWWVLGSFVGIIAVFLITYTYVQSLNSFEYEGIEINKVMYGEIPFYQYSYVTDNSYVSGLTVATDGTKVVDVYLREDPRKNTVPIEGEIDFLPREKYVYLSINSTDMLCPYGTVAIANLVSFLSQNGYRSQAAFPDAIEAAEANETYANCETHPNNMVILLQAGEQSSVVKQGENCYVISTADCEILASTEKFIVQSILDAKAKG